MPPKDPSEIAAATRVHRKLLVEGGGNLHRAAIACGVRRYIQQVSSFFHEPGEGLADESAGLAVDASPRVATYARTYAELEARVLHAGAMEGIALRYGFFYGPRTCDHPGGASADQVRRQHVPVIGDGGSVWSWIQIEDAAVATADVLAAPPGVYNIVDDDRRPWPSGCRRSPDSSVPASAADHGATGAGHGRRSARTSSIAPYDDAWPQAFATERDRIAASLGPLALRIEHHGSTSVRGLAAKPVIDIQISVAQLHPLEHPDHCSWPSRVGDIAIRLASANPCSHRREQGVDVLRPRP
jgi:GrpB protein